MTDYSYEDEDVSPATENTSKPISSSQIPFHSCPRYNGSYTLSDNAKREIAELAVEIAKSQQDQEIGRLTKKGFAYLIGLIVAGLFSWLTSHGFITHKT